MSQTNKPDTETAALVPNVKDDHLALTAAKAGVPWIGSSYYAAAEKDMDWQWQRHIYPKIKTFDLSSTIDLACGHGRNVPYLKSEANELWLIDILQENIDVCRTRFADATGLHYSVTQGTRLDGVPNEWASFVYCFDAMVHFDPDIVRSYIIDTMRVLKPGGHAFFHHSNYSSDYKASWATNPHARNFMSAEFFAFFAARAGLSVVEQEKIQWGGIQELDCITVLQKF